MRIIINNKVIYGMSNFKPILLRIFRQWVLVVVVIIIIARFYSLTNVAMPLLRSDSNSYSLLVGSDCLRKQTDIRHAVAWKGLDLNPGPPDTKQPLYHLCYLAFESTYYDIEHNIRSLHRLIPLSFWSFLYSGVYFVKSVIFETVNKRGEHRFWNVCERYEGTKC